MRFFKDDSDEFIPFDEWDGGMMSHHFYQSEYEYRQVMSESKINKCACGYDPNNDLLDCFRKVNRYSETSRLVCPEHNGGCGVWVQGSTKDETIAKWNRQEYEKPEDY